MYSFQRLMVSQSVGHDLTPRFNEIGGGT